MMLRAEIYVVGSDNSRTLYGACEKEINPQRAVSSICAFTKQCERFISAVDFGAVLNLLQGRDR